MKKAASAAILTLTMILSAVLVSVPVHAHAEPLESGAADAISLDKDWHLWLDTSASWKDDALYLPDEVDLTKLPVNPPTGDWTLLDGKAGIAVPTLPATVEQYYWGQAPCKVANPTRPDDIVTLDGSYQGVSWWYRTFTPPDLKAGEHLVISFPGARLRAEVYINGQLAAYNLITESAFTADATKALKRGAPNVLAVRITNPGGNFSWGDFNLIQWGKYGIPVSHGFGGLDGGVTMAVRGPAAVSNLVVFNQPDPHSVSLSVDVTSTGPAADKPLLLSIRRADKEVWKGTVLAHIPANGTVTVTQPVMLPGAELWDIGHPALYTADARFAGDDHSAWKTTFGFRWFSAENIGQDAKLYLNGRRIVVKSSISWGLWAPNGMFPDRAAANREVAAAQSLGLNAIQNHRHMPKPVVLDAFDQAGLMRYCEPGAGTFTLRNTPEGGVPHGSGPVDPSGKGGEPTTWFNRYELAKVLAMVRANRSHPSVIIWSLQNELDPSDLHNPKVFYTLRKIHELDPSRIVMLKSGGGPQNEAWAMPYSDDFLHDDGKGYSGWWDQHTADNCPGIPEIPTTSVSVYQDGMYKSPQDFSYRVTNEREIMTWGELAIGASADDHPEIVKWYKDNNLNSGYDLAAHGALAAAYDKALDKYGFLAAFPDTETLFRQVAAKQYFNAARLSENVRISDPNDYLVLSGWESTAIENHSGMVDSLRHVKGDPAPIREALAPALLVVRPRQLVLDKGETAVVDVHLVNEINLHGAFTLSVSANQGGQKPFFSQAYPVNATGGEKFGELLKDNIKFTPPEPGSVTVSATLGSANTATPALKREASLLVVDAQPAPIRKTVAYVGEAEPIASALKARLGITAIALSDAPGQIDEIIVDTNLWRYEKASSIQKADNPDLYKEQYSHPAGNIAEYRDLAPGTLKVELFFAETHWEKPGQRVFDVALNDRTVLEKLDLVGESGGRGVPVTKSFDVDSPDGKLKVSVPQVETDRALFAAIRVTDAKNKVITQVFRPKDYNDAKNGVKWRAADLAAFDWKPVLPRLLERVRAGSRLIILTSGHQDAGQAAAALAAEKLLTYSGMVGQSNAAWLGFWYFGRKHWLLDGLPSDCVLDWAYQITSGDGCIMEAPKLEAVVGYGMHHSARVGLGAAVLPVEKGEIVLLGLQNLEETFVAGTDHAFHHTTARRILYNALH